MKKSIAGLFITVLLVMLLTGAVLFFNARHGKKILRRSEFPAMGTLCAIAVYGSEAQLNLAFAVGKAELDRVTAACSLYDPDSELSRLNRSAGSREFCCSEAMYFLIKRAQKAYLESNGAFDITVKPLMDLWGFYRKQGKTPPSESEITNTLAKVGFEKLILNDSRRSVRFSVPGMALDLGGIAKGYAADLAAAAIVKKGITAGVVDIGGNLRFLPFPPPGRKTYRVAIRDPRRREQTLPGFLEVDPGRAVSTSGDYERFVVLDGKRYSHIISPETGMPGSVAAVTVVADNALDADIFSTSCCLGGADIAKKLTALYPRININFCK